MLRNRVSRHDFAGYPQQVPPQTPPVSTLDPKDERLLELSEIAGRLDNQCELLNEDNRRLEQENEDLRRQNKELRDRNLRLESEAAAEKAGYESVNDLIEAVKKKLKEDK